MNDIDISFLQIFVLTLFLLWCLYLGRKLYKYETRKESERIALSKLVEIVKMHGRFTDLDYKSYMYFSYEPYKDIEELTEFKQYKSNNPNKNYY